MLWVGGKPVEEVNPEVEVDDFVELISGSIRFRVKVEAIDGDEFIGRITDCPTPGADGKPIRFENRHVAHLEKKHDDI